jgi:osmotically inducible lipoprotein OsmB
MKKAICLTIAMATTLALTGCNSNNPNDRAVGGALIGGGTGALIGGLASGTAGGALVGAAIGAAGGAVIGHATTPRSRCAQFQRNWDGTTSCVAWYR